MQQVEAIGELPYCKGLWSVICGTTTRCDKALVVDEIKSATRLLKDGINFFKCYTEASLQKVYKTNPPARMYDLIGKLAPLLNLDATIAWDLICNFMLYEYRNCGETFASQLSDMTSMRNLIEDIWSFYYFERITLIKCLKLMAEYRNEAHHPHSEEFKNFFNLASADVLLRSVREQIESLKFINPPIRVGMFGDHHLHRLYNSSLVEMRELLHVMTIFIDEKRPSAGEFEAIYGSICGEPRRLVSTKSHEDKELVAKKLDEIRHCRTGLLVVCLDVTKHEDTSQLIRELRVSMRDILEHKCLRESTSQDGPFLLAWMLANYAIEPDNPETLNQFRPFGVRAIQLDVFRQLQTLLDTEMIREDTRYARVVRSSVYNLLTLLCSFVDDTRVSSFNGIFEAVGSTLRYPELADLFWNERGRDAGLWPYYNRAVALFPYRFEPLTVIATGLASASKSSAEKIAELLERLESVTLEVPRNRNTSNNIINTGAPRQSLKPYEHDCTMHRNDFTIEPDCQRIIVEITTSDTEIVTWNKRSRYGDAFHHKIEQLFSQAGAGMTSVSELETSLPEHVYQGFCLLVELLSADLDITPSMVIPTEMSLEIINRFSYPVLPSKIYNIIGACCRVTSRLVLKYPEEILSRMRIGVYPRFNDTYQSTKDLARAVSFDGGLIASWLSGIESIQHRYTILSTYLDTLWNYLVMRHSKETMYTIEIPGMVFLLQAVLPKLDTWYFESETERIDLWYKGMSCLNRALDSNLPKGEPRKELQLVVAYSLLYLEPRNALLKLVRTGEQSLQCKMMNETDWLSGKGFRIIRSVQFALSLVNRLLMFRHSLGIGHDERSPLEIDLYASPCVPNGLLIVPTIVNYLYVWFSPALQAMAVRLLKKFAQGFSMSLLVCMGMDGTAIRETFASRLMSPTCSAEVKIAILDLVAVCLERQPGLTEALFNIMHQAERRRIFPRPADEFLTEGCSSFLDLYLRRIEEEDRIVEDSLYDGTMSLLRAMWYNRNEILVNYFRKREKFWTQLFAPLTRSLLPQARGYAQLLDIITLELFETSPPSIQENDFSTNLEKLLLKRDHWDRITRYVLGYQDDSTSQNYQDKATIESPLYQTNIEAWYNFIVTLTDPRISNDLVNRIEIARIRDMTRITLNSLSTRLKKINVEISDARITMLLASLALRCVTTWKNDCVEKNDTFVVQIVQLMQDMIHSYGSYGFALRRTLLALILGCIQLVGTSIAADTASLEYLLAQACTLSCIELRKLEEIERLRRTERRDDDDENASGENEDKETRGENENFEKNDDDTSKLPSNRDNNENSECGPGTLAISMVTQLLRCDVDKNSRQSSRLGRRSTCFQLRQMIPQLMAYLGMTVQKYRCLMFSKAALELLGAVSRSPYYNPSPSPIDDEESIAKLWLALVPPNSLGNSILDSLYDDRTSQGSWRCRDWWSVYTLGLEFVTGLVNGVGVTSDDPNCDTTPSCPAHVKPIVLFLGSHENHMLQASTLLRHTADPLAIDLVQSLVALVSALSVRPNVWSSVQPSVCDSLMKCMYLVYDSTVNLLLRPRILKFIIDGVSVESAEELQSCDDKLLSVELKLLVNKLIVVNWWCAQCFVRFSPRLNALVDTIYTQDFWCTTLAEMNFGPPQMSMNSAPRLTYGTIISSTQLFTQALYSLSLNACSSGTPATIGGGSSNSGGTIAGRRSNSTTDSLMDSAKREWERAIPENSRRIHAKDLRRILHTGRPTTSSCEFSSYVTGHDVTVPLLGNPRLLRRPYDPLICENTILSRATQFVHHGTRHVGKTTTGHNIVTPNSGQNTSSTIGHTSGGRNDRNETATTTTNPWFASMNEKNSRLALEINLVLILCQTLEGVKSPRLALRDRQLIVRETANEIGVFFDFLEQRAETMDNEEEFVEAALVGSGFHANASDNVRNVRAPETNQCPLELNARLLNDSKINKVPVSQLNHNCEDSTIAAISEETRLNDDIVTTGSFVNCASNNVRFLPLLGKLLKSMLESLDSARYS